MVSDACYRSMIDAGRRGLERGRMKRVDDRLRRQRCRNVDILRRDADQAVAHTAADEAHGARPRRFERRDDFHDWRVARPIELERVAFRQRRQS